jgi:hypothetical protein
MANAAGGGPDFWSYVALPVTWVLRPRLHPSIDAPRCREQVSWVDDQGNPLRPSIFLRLNIENKGATVARDRSVLVTGISRDGVLLESEPSKLAWTDRPRDGMYEPAVLRHGPSGRKYVDVCGNDPARRQLLVIGEKREKGYHRFDAPGIYTIDFEIEAAFPSIVHRGRVKVLFEHEPWDSCRFLVLEDRQPFFKRRLSL